MAFVRQSKYRHVFGTPCKKDQCYDNIRVSKSSSDGDFCAVNSKFIAIVTESSGGGSFLVLKHEETGRVDLNHPQVTGHKAVVLDLAWNPFHDNIIASASEDCSVKVWHIPDEGLSEHLINPVVDLQFHQKRVGQVLWHPSASNILLSVSHNVIVIWNAEESLVVNEINCHPELIFSVSWNYNGSLIASTCKDKKVRVIDPRTGVVKQEGSSHSGSKVARVQFTKNHKLFTTGFSKTSERQYALWDANDLSKPLTMEKIDDSNSPLIINYDPDLNLVYLTGKGDTQIRYYEITEQTPYVFWLNMFQSNLTQRSCGFIPKRCINVNTHEIARIFKLIPKGTCEPVSMVVPRKSDTYQDDIYPDTASGEPALTADEWISGKDKDPILMSLKDGYKSTRPESKAQANSKVNLLANITKKPTTSTPAASNAAVSKPTPSSASASINGTPTPSSQSSGSLSDSSPSKTAHPEPVTAKPKPQPLTAKPKVEIKPQQEDGIIELKGALSDVTVYIVKHEARIAVLEELSHFAFDEDPARIETSGPLILYISITGYFCGPYMRTGSVDVLNKFGGNRPKRLGGEAFVARRKKKHAENRTLATAKSQNKELSDLKAEMEKLKELVKNQEDRIAALESKV